MRPRLLLAWAVVCGALSACGGEPIDSGGVSSSQRNSSASSNSLISSSFAANSQIANSSLNDAFSSSSSGGASALTLPGVIQSEDFMRYYDTSTANRGACGSAAGEVDLVNAVAGSPGTCDIGHTASGEWLEYDVQVAQSGYYRFQLGLASGQVDKQITLLIDGSVIATFTAPAKGWQAFEYVVSSEVQVGAGAHTLRVEFDTGLTNFDDIKVDYLGDDTGGFEIFTGIGSAVPVHTAPGAIQSEDFHRFGESTTTNLGHCGPSDSPVDLTPVNPNWKGTCDISHTTAGEWLEYDFAVTAPGNYQMVVNASAVQEGKRVRVFVNGDRVGTANVAATQFNDFAAYRVGSKTLAIGTHTARIVFLDGGVNFNYFAVNAQNLTVSDGPAATPTAIPARIQSEDFSRAGDTTASNNGGCGPSNTAVDLVTKRPNWAGTCDVGGTAAGEWLEYDIDVSEAGFYAINLSLSAEQAGKSVELFVNGVAVGTVIPAANGFLEFAPRTVQDVSLIRGKQTVKLVFNNNDVNFNYIEFIRQNGPSQGSATTSSSSNSSAPANESLPGKQAYQEKCSTCHGLNGNDGDYPMNYETLSRNELINAIASTMPLGNPGSCNTACATDITEYILQVFNGDGTIDEVSCDEATRVVGKTYFRRLTQREYSRVIADALAIDGSFGGFIPEVDRAGFISTGSELGSFTEFSAYDAAAESIAAEAVQFSPVVAAVIATPAAIAQFIEDVGLKMFRRPLSPAENSLYLQLYQSGVNHGGVATGIEWVLSGFLASPNFIYFIEKGDLENITSDGRIPLTPYERAARLSFFLTGAIPDAMLFEAAKRNELVTAAQVRAQARRLVESARGRDQIVDFMMQWLGAKTSNEAALARLADFDPGNRNAVSQLQASLATMIRNVLASDQPTLENLLTTNLYFTNNALANSWGLNLDQALGSAMSPFITEGELRSGVLTHPAVLGVHSSDGFANATLRGEFLLSHLMCKPVPFPDNDVMSQFPVIEAPLSTDRETLTVLHAKEDACYACHSVMDPAGFGFENFDSRGKFRSFQELIPGQPTQIDASGSVRLDGVDYFYNDAPELVSALASSPQVQSCVSKYVLRFALARKETEADQCSLEQQKATLPESGASIMDMFIEMAVTDALLYFGGVTTQ